LVDVIQKKNLKRKNHNLLYNSFEKRYGKTSVEHYN